MADVITMKDGRVQVILEISTFANLIGDYMGFDSWLYFKGLIEKHNRAVNELKSVRKEIETYVLRTLLPKMPLDDYSREAWAEEFLAKMEDVYGLET